MAQNPEKEEIGIVSPRSSKGSNSGNKVSPKDFVFGKLLGEGSFSSVYLAKHASSSIEYAIKVCEKQHITREKKIKNVYRERDVMNLLNSKQDSTAPYFVHLAYAFHCPTNLYFAMTYCKNGELLKWLKKIGNFDRRCASFYSGEILKALEHLHSLGIIHRDIKPENIILYNDMHIKITDFGSAKILTGDPESDRRSSFVGTAQYVSPEVLESKPVSKASDLWALGCVIYQLISGLPPFDDQSEYIIIKSIQKLDYVIPDGFDPDAKDLVEKLLVLDRDSRIGASDSGVYTSIRQHPFYSDLNIDTLYLQTPPEICAYMPELEEAVSWPDNLAPGLGPDVIRRLEFGTTEFAPSKTQQEGMKKDLTLSMKEQKLRLEEQQKSNDYHCFVEEHLIVKQGLLDKRKGLFPRRRMFLLTTGPRLYYVDPVNKVLKGQVPLDQTMRIDPKNFKTFFVHTPNRTYYLEDPNGTSHEWCHALESIRDHYFPKKS